MPKPKTPVNHHGIWMPLLKEKELWLLLLLGILYFYRPLFLQETFFFRDLGLHDLPDKQLLVDFIRAGELPLWDPYKHGGRPYWANIIHFTLYPANLLYLFLPLIKAFNVTIVLHFLGCSACAYLCSRVIGLRPVSSCIVGLVYGYCGYVLSLANILNRILAMPYIPLLLVFWHLVLLQKKRRWFIMTVVAGVFQVFTGAPETNIMSLVFLLGWGVVYPYPHRSRARILLLWALLGVCIVGIASVQLFPTLEAASLSSRGQGIGYFAFSHWSLHPRRLPEMFFPGFLGEIDNLFWDLHYWGRLLINGEMPYILSIYFGGAVIMLACVGGLHRERNSVLPFRVRILLLVLSILSFLFSLGRFLPFFHFLYEHVPFIALFRYPIKSLISGIFPVALLAGYASEIHFGQHVPNGRQYQDEPTIQNDRGVQSVPSRTFLAGLWGIATILLIVMITLILSPDASRVFREFFFKQSGGEIAHQGVISSFTHTLAIWLLVTLLYQYRRLKQGWWQHWLLAVILVVDLLPAGKTVNLYAPEAFFTDIPDAVHLVRKEIGDGRFFHPPKDPSQFSLQVPSQNIMWMYRWDFESLNDYLAAFYKIPVIFHLDVDGMANFYLRQLTDLVDLFPWEQRLPLLSAGGVTLILTSEALSLPGVHFVAEIPNRSNVSLYLYRNENAAARLEFVTNWIMSNSDDDVLHIMVHPDFDPRTHVVLQKPEILFSFPILTRQSRNERFFQKESFTPEAERMQHIHLPASRERECPPSQIKKLSSNSLSEVLSISNQCDGYLVFLEPFYPGWRVYIDGKQVPILRANFAFSAVLVKAGEHIIERQYRPNSLVYGVLGSILCCGLLGIIMSKGWWWLDSQ